MAIRKWYPEDFLTPGLQLQSEAARICEDVTERLSALLAQTGHYQCHYKVLVMRSFDVFVAVGPNEELNNIYRFVWGALTPCDFATCILTNCNLSHDLRYIIIVKEYHCWITDALLYHILTCYFLVGTILRTSEVPCRTFLTNRCQQSWFL